MVLVNGCYLPHHLADPATAVGDDGPYMPLPKFAGTKSVSLHAIFASKALAQAS